jgi:hypothetical protein
MEPVRVFISYSHKDEALRAELDEHLALLKREGVIATWHDRDIRAGDDWKQTLDAKLETADVILLLVSPAFIGSDYCYGVEMARALKRYEAGTALVIPVIVRPCDWSSAPFARLHCLPRYGPAVTRWRSHDEAWLDVVMGLRWAVNTRAAAPVPRAAPARHRPQSALSSRVERVEEAVRTMTLRQWRELLSSVEMEPNAQRQLYLILLGVGGFCAAVMVGAMILGKSPLPRSEALPAAPDPRTEAATSLQPKVTKVSPVDGQISEQAPPEHIITTRYFLEAWKKGEGAALMNQIVQIRGPVAYQPAGGRLIFLFPEPRMGEWQVACTQEGEAIFGDLKIDQWVTVRGRVKGPSGENSTTIHLDDCELLTEK